MRNSRLSGFAIGALAAAFYGTNPLFTLPLYHEGLFPDEVLFFRYALAFVLLCPAIFFLHKPLRLAPREILPVLGLGILFAVSSESLFDAYLYIDVGIASTLLFVYPVLVAVFMILFFHEKFAWTALTSVLLATVGIALLNRSSSGAKLNPVGFWLVMLSALTYAGYIIGVNRPFLARVGSLTIVFYSLLAGSAFYGVQALVRGSLNLPQTPVGWIDVFGLAIFPTVLAILGTTLSIRLIGPTPAAILGALEPVTAVLIGSLVFGEHLTPRILCGIFLVLAAVSVKQLAPPANSSAA